MLANKRVWEAHRGGGVGVLLDLEWAECSLFRSCLELGEWYPDCVWAAAREKCARWRWRERDRSRSFVCAVVRLSLIHI